MYGSIARLKPKPGQESAVVELMREWAQGRGAKVGGFESSLVYRPDDRPEELVMVVAFADKASYDANADDPEQDKWYQRFREALQEDPAWEDGEIVYP